MQESLRRLTGSHLPRFELPPSVIELRKRTRYDIYLDVLETVRRRGPSPITRLSYGVGLPVDRTKKVVEFLLSRGLLRKVNIGERDVYRMTDRGGEFLQALRTVRKFVQ